MYAFFLISGVVDMVGYSGTTIPDGLDYCTLALALAIEGLLFASHVHGREILDIHIHLLLVKVIAATVVVVLLEARFRRHPLLPLGRAFLLMLQGTWFWAVAVILYKHGQGHSDWDLSSPESVMMATIYFSWHCAVIFVVMIFMHLLMARFYLGRSGEKSLLPSRERLHNLSKATWGEVPNSDTKYSILSSDEDMDSNDNDGGGDFNANNKNFKMERGVDFEEA
ncbi:transmembrane protein 45B [Elysia marginata]|uniref:Transmembrane protein 45B n=1 Tax=Elysia marginata TaxID=1093978 RepID=A0AAV4HJ55_9GAST|nr:transmembrane protein 45B [Elysia marginata]